MEKIRIKELPVFPSVAAVLGKAEAERQLFIASSGYALEDQDSYHEWNWFDKDLIKCFQWDCTPQGFMYWDNINDRISLGEDYE